MPKPRMLMRRWHVAGVLVAAVMVLAACGAARAQVPPAAMWSS